MEIEKVCESILAVVHTVFYIYENLFKKINIEEVGVGYFRCMS